MSLGGRWLHPVRQECVLSLRVCVSYREGRRAEKEKRTVATTLAADRTEGISSTNGESVSRKSGSVLREACYSRERMKTRWKERQEGGLAAWNEGWRVKTDSAEGCKWHERRGEEGEDVWRTIREICGDTANAEGGWNEFIFTEAACICGALRRVCRARYADRGRRGEETDNRRQDLCAVSANFTRSCRFA